MSELADKLAEFNHYEQWEDSALLAYQNKAAVISDPTASWNAGWALFQLGRFEDALPFLEWADDLDPTTPTGSWARGVVLSELRRFTEAEHHLLRSIQCKSGYLNRAALALVYLQTGRLEAAERCHLEGLAEKRTRERLEHYASFLGDTGRALDKESILLEAAVAPIEGSLARRETGH